MTQPDTEFDAELDGLSYEQLLELADALEIDPVLRTLTEES